MPARSHRSYGWSRPVRARGLKLHVAAKPRRARVVAPRTGAWIETLTTRNRCDSAEASRPVRARGLKQSDRLQPIRSVLRRAPYGRVD